MHPKKVNNKKTNQKNKKIMSNKEADKKDDGLDQKIKELKDKHKIRQSAYNKIIASISKKNRGTTKNE